MVGKPFVFVAASLILAAHAHAAVLCRTHTETVKVRDACKPTETQMDPVTLGLQPRLVVKDTNGAVVGILEPGHTAIHHYPDRGGGIYLTNSIDSFPEDGGGNLVATRIANTPVCLTVCRDGFQEVGGIHFTSTDCSGTPLLTADGGSGPTSALALVLTAPVGGCSAYYPTSVGVTLRLVRSSLLVTDSSTCLGSFGGSFTAPNRCCAPESESRYTVDAATFDLATLGPVPPFHVEGP